MNRQRKQPCVYCGKRIDESYLLRHYAACERSPYSDEQARSDLIKIHKAAQVFVMAQGHTAFHATKITKYEAERMARINAALDHDEFDFDTSGNDLFIEAKGNYHYVK